MYQTKIQDPSGKNFDYGKFLSENLCESIIHLIKERVFSPIRLFDLAKISIIV